MDKDKKNVNASEWPPPISRTDTEADQPAIAKDLLTNAAWMDAVLGCVSSFVSFVILSLLLFNPVAAVILSPADSMFSSGARLWTCWCLAAAVNAIAWWFFRVRDLPVMYNSIALTAIPVGLLWAGLIWVLCAVG